MKPLIRHEGIMAALDRSHVDTDQIIPKQFLKRVGRTGYGQFLFYDWRYRDDGRTPNPDFPLNRPEYAGASILLTRENFGCGSSREHAAWALADYGFRVVIAPSFADIFYNNCFKNGLLPVVLDAAAVDELFMADRAAPGLRLVVDLEQCRIELPGRSPIPFTIDGFRRDMLMRGFDEIAFTLERAGKIAAYESRRAPWGGPAA